MTSRKEGPAQRSHPQFGRDWTGGKTVIPGSTEPERYLQGSLSSHGEVAHLKVIGLCEGSFAVANLVSSRAVAEMSLPSRSQVQEADVIVNARVAMDPSLLEEEVRRAVEAACQARQGRAEFRQTQSLRPGRPTPTHRYAEAK